jgi:hypothetical protein
VIDRVFIGTDNRLPVLDDGTPTAPYARLLLTQCARVTAAMIEPHHRYMERVVPPDVQAWLRARSRRLAELTDAEIDEIAERLRLFRPNPLAEYDPTHVWVDPNGYRLSDRIWRTDEETRRKLDAMLRDQIAQGTGSERLARLVEQFLIPGRAKVRTERPYGVDASYDAMRLARTEIARAANEAAFIAAWLNPYVEKIEIVRSAQGDRDCKVCPQHATIGIFGERLRPAYRLGEARISPYHPHCMCRVESVVTQDPDAVTADLRRVMESAEAEYLSPYMTPLQMDGFIEQLLGQALFDLLRQVAPLQPPLF